VLFRTDFDISVVEEEKSEEEEEFEEEDAPTQEKSD
jgi:hypothetical protein